MYKKILIFSLITGMCFTTCTFPQASSKDVSIKKTSYVSTIEKLQNKNVNKIVKLKVGKGVKIKKITYKSTNKKILNISKNKINVKKAGTVNIKTIVKYKKNKKSKSKTLNMKIKIARNSANKPIVQPTIKPSTGSAITKNTTTPPPSSTSSPSVKRTYSSITVNLVDENGNPTKGYIYINDNKIFVDKTYYVEGENQNFNIKFENEVKDSKYNKAIGYANLDEQGNMHQGMSYTQVIKSEEKITQYTSATVRLFDKKGNPAKGYIYVNGVKTYVDELYSVDMINTNIKIKCENQGELESPDIFLPIPMGNTSMDEQGIVHESISYVFVVDQDMTREDFNTMIQSGIKKVPINEDGPICLREICVLNDDGTYSDISYHESAYSTGKFYKIKSDTIRTNVKISN